MKPSFDLWIEGDKEWKEARRILKKLHYKEGFVPLHSTPVWVAVYGKTGIRDSEMIYDCYASSKGYGSDGNERWQIDNLRDLEGLS